VGSGHLTLETSLTDGSLDAGVIGGDNDPVSRLHLGGLLCHAHDQRGTRQISQSFARETTGCVSGRNHSEDLGHGFTFGK
jgi:hypothetical protein